MTNDAWTVTKVQEWSCCTEGQAALCLYQNDLVKEKSPVASVFFKSIDGYWWCMGVLQDCPFCVIIQLKVWSDMYWLQAPDSEMSKIL